MHIPHFPNIYHQFIEDTIEVAENHGIKIRFSDGALVYARGEKVGSAGYFSAEDKVLAVSTADFNITQIMQIFIHESCHMEQWLFNKKMWNLYSPGYGKFMEWLDKKMELSESKVSKHLQDVIALELDCEKRVIKKIKKYGLPIDPSLYKKNANTYLYGIIFCSMKRKWYNKLYTKDEIVHLAPSRFRSKYEKIPKKILEAFEYYAH